VPGVLARSNLAEGSGRFGADRRHHFRIAYGSLLELDAGLEVARRFGWLRELPAIVLRRRLGGLLWSLARSAGVGVGAGVGLGLGVGADFGDTRRRDRPCRASILETSSKKSQSPRHGSQSHV
jgi:hypothetical protein